MLGSSASIRVRRAAADDAEVLERIFRASWLNAYAGIIPALALDGMLRKRNGAWWRRALGSGGTMLVLEVGEAVAGYVTLGPARTRGAGTGEIYELYVDPVHQGLGFGEHLFERARAEIDKRGYRRLMVWALTANVPAAGFYWRRGGRPVAIATERIGGAKLEKTGFSWD